MGLIIDNGTGKLSDNAFSYIFVENLGVFMAFSEGSDSVLQRPHQFGVWMNTTWPRHQNLTNGIFLMTWRNIIGLSVVM